LAIGVVTTEAKIQNNEKLRNNLHVCWIFCTSRKLCLIMLNLDTKSIIQSRDIIWLNEAYYDWIERKVLQKKENDHNDHDDFIENSKIQKIYDGQDKSRSSQDQYESKMKGFTGLVVSEATRLIQLLSYLINELHQRNMVKMQMPHIFCRIFRYDETALEISRVPNHTRHINVIYHNFRSKLLNESIYFQSIISDNNMADILTKQLPTSFFVIIDNYSTDGNKILFLHLLSGSATILFK
jgi:hypothetical protein